MQELLKPFIEHNLNFTPAGIWEMIEGKKKAIDANRYDDLKWENYPKDNMGRIKLPDGYIVLDIDRAKTTITTSIEGEKMISIPSLDLELPLGLYSQTSREGAYHIYYNITPEQQELVGSQSIIKLHNLEIDILQNYIIFEGHSFSEDNKIYAGSINNIPATLMCSIEEHIDNAGSHSSSRHLSMSLHSNIQRYNLVEMFLSKKTMKITARNSLVKSLLPKEYMEVFKNSKRFNFIKNPLSYDLMNKIAVKLSTTKELDYHEHVLPTIHMILEEYEVDPNSRQSIQRLQQISCGLPQHKSIMPYQIDDDEKTFQDLMGMQPDTDFAILRTIHRQKKKFVRIDKYSLEPILHGGEFLLEQGAAQVLNPERQQYSADGKPTVWDEADLPIVELIEDPYAPPYSLDKYSRHCINLIHRSEFVSNAAPEKKNVDNLLVKVMESTIHPDYLDIMYYYHAHVIFSNSSPVMIPWMATGSMVRGGTGKSMVTITIPGKILGPMATQVDLTKLASGYDMTGGVRLLTLEDTNPDAKQQWSAAYAVMKQLQSAAYTKVNPKYGVTQVKKVKVTITGSSNSIPRLSPSDRRFLCMEPAHLDGYTLPLSVKDADELKRFEQDEGGAYDEVIQEYVNYLFHLYSEGTPPHIERQLYGDTLPTIYRKNWVISGVTNVKSMMLTLPIAEDFLASVHEDRIAEDNDKWLMLIGHLVQMHNANEGVVSLSWAWFREVIPYIANDIDHDMTKKSIGRMLGVDFQSGAAWAQKLQKGTEFNRYYAIRNGKDIPLAMYSIRLSSVQDYIDYLESEVKSQQAISDGLEDLEGILT